MPTPFTVYNGGSNTSLVNALLAANSGIEIIAGSIQLNASGLGAVNYYDGSLTPLGIGAGLLLTSGTTPGVSNTLTWFGTDNSGSSGFNNGSASINAVVNTVFNTVSYDATTLAFSFTALDPTATSVTFDLVFGSDEYPEWVDQFVDCATVLVNGVNYALFNHDPMHPLSVVSSNLAAGYFIDNANNALPIEYDGVSHVLKIVAPIHAGTNQIEIAIADTGDHIYDSGIFIANLAAGNVPGSGVVIDSPTSGTNGNDTLSGTSKDEYFDAKDGDDTIYAGGGDDIVSAGAGNDAVYGGSGADIMKGDAGDDLLDGGDGLDTVVYAGVSTDFSLTYDSSTNTYQLTDNNPADGSEGVDTLVNTEYAQFSDGLFELTAAGLVPVVIGGGISTNNTGSVVISGIGSVGNTLTALVNDIDGVPAQVNYQWQILDLGIWSDIGTNSANYTVANGDVGKSIRVVASYTDNANHAEAPVSADKAILDPNAGDLVVTLIQLQTPIGASTMNPLTTLVQDAIDLGVSPNLAAIHVRDVLGLDPSINLLHYDAWSVLQTAPFDATALQVEMVAVQTAILTSLSDDDTGVNLALAIVNAAENGQQLDLASASDLAGILGIDITGITDKNLYPQPLREIFDRNKAMSDAIADGSGVDAIEQEWQDLLSIQDNIASTSIADLSIHINQAPIGSATAILADGAAGLPYMIYATDLLAGFSDPEGDTLMVIGLGADQGVVTPAGGNAWTFTPAAGFMGGPVELSYQVSDGNGGIAPGSQMFILAAANHAPTLEIPVGDQLAACKTLFTYAVPDGTFADQDAGDTLSLSASMADGSALPKWLSFDPATGVFSGIPALAHIGTLEITLTATDSTGASVADTFVLDVRSLIEGGAANDVLLGTWAADYILGYEGNDKLVGNSGDDYLDGGDGDDTLYGSLGVDTLLGGMGNDILNGGQGADTMIGGIGDDRYWVDDVGDVVVELADEGMDRVIATIDYTLGDTLENLTLTGAGNISGIGNDLDNSITGNSGDNYLEGGLGNDSLNGGLGVDTMIGGAGNDKYWVDDVGDVVVELADEGTDRVFAAIDYTLGNALENLSLIGTSNISGVGNDLNNFLVGNAGDNTLQGGLGNDYLTGGGGADMLDGGEGNDQAIYTASSSAVQINLAAGTAAGGDAEGDVLTNIEHLAGSAWDDELIGNALANFLSGKAGSDILNGGDGNDVLVGGLGNDTLTGGAGKDVFRFADLLDANENLDTILDFESNIDRIQLDLNVFDAIGVTGKLSAANFSDTGVAMDGDDYIIYDKASGALSYDSDGSGAALAIMFAQLGANTQLASGDFNVI